MSSIEAQNNVGHMERHSSSTEPMAQLGKVMGSSKIHPEKDPFGEAAQIWIHSFWSGPQDCIKILAHHFQSNSGWKVSLLGSGVQPPDRSTQTWALRSPECLQAWRSNNLSGQLNV